MAIIFKKITSTLSPNENTHVFTDSLINNNSVIELYCSDNEVYPVNVIQSGEHSITVEYSEHSTEITIAITINNATTFEPYDDTDVLLSINELSIDKQDKLTAGENITISEDNVISAVGGSATTSLKELSDVDVVPIDGKALIFDNITNKWVQEELNASYVNYVGPAHQDDNLSNIIEDIYNKFENDFTVNEQLVGTYLGFNLYRKVFRTTESITSTNKEYTQTDLTGVKWLVNVVVCVEHSDYSWVIPFQARPQNNHIYGKGISGDTPDIGYYTDFIVYYTKVGE